MGKKYFDISWDFRTADTKEYTHCFHNYPAMMIPQIARRLIEKYGEKSKTLFDPYCGTGTSLVEASLRNINSIGTEINPLARLITLVKTTPINIKIFDNYFKLYNDEVFALNFGKKLTEVEIPNFSNINFWFDKLVQIKLAIINEFVNKIEKVNIKNFFKVAFSETVRECSWTRNSEFKLYRMTETQMKKFNPDVFSIMANKLLRNRNGMISYLEAKKNKPTCKIYQFNTVSGIPSKVIPDNSVDIIVTSPPYGDSRTTVAYGQFSRLSNQWLGFERANEVDKRAMGGLKQKEKLTFSSKNLNDILNQIVAKDANRADDVISFYLDYKKSIDNISHVIKKGGIICYVVGNRRVKGVTLETDEITKEFFNNNHFEHIETIIRNIPNKRMPLKNCPTNVSGNKDVTMSNEYIVIMKKY